MGRQLKRRVKIEAIRQQDLDSATADSNGSRAVLHSAQASLDAVGLNLGYASVNAPISGRVGHALVSEGALAASQERRAPLVGLSNLFSPVGFGSQGSFYPCVSDRWVY